MEFFQRAKTIRLFSHHGKYLLADDDKVTVIQDRDGSSKEALWEVELVPTYDHVMRFKSCYGNYLTASNVPFLLGMSGKRVLQTMPTKLDSSIEWEPLIEGMQVKFKTRYGHYLRANGGLPPWRNSITHDRAHRNRTTGRDWDLWEVEVVECRPKPAQLPPPSPAAEPKPEVEPDEDSDSEPEKEVSDSPTSISLPSPSKPRKKGRAKPSSPGEGRLVHYRLADDNGDFMNNKETTITFKGSGLEELIVALEEQTGLEDVIVCSPWIGKLYPLRLQLPPNNAPMHVVVVPHSSRAAEDLEIPGNVNMTEKTEP